MNSAWAVRKWRPLGYSLGPALWRVFVMFVFIVSGVLVIYGVEAFYNVTFGPWTRRIFSQLDWDTVASIWVAEIPLAFLIATLLERRTAVRDTLQNEIENFLAIAEKRGIPSFEHLKYVRVVVKRRMRGLREPKTIGYLINADTGIAMKVQGGGVFWRLMAEGLFDRLEDMESESEFRNRCALKDIQVEESTSFPLMRPNEPQRRARETNGKPVLPWS